MQANSKSALIAAVVAMALWPGVARADAIGVTVNGTPVTFAGQPPMEQAGHVLVPLRGVFESMGAAVDYDTASHTVTAVKGDTHIVLPIGSTVAMVNGQDQTLSEPAQIVNGSTMVPLRFVAEALGGDVEWQDASNNVAITTVFAHTSDLPPPPGGNVVTGQLTGVYASDSPRRITMRVDGEQTAISLSDSATFLRHRPGESAEVVALTDIQSGDQVTVQRDDQGYAETITANYGVLRGTVKSIESEGDGSHLVTLNDGTKVSVISGAELRMNGREIGYSDIQTDEPVAIRTSPDNSFGYAILVNPGGGPGGPPAPEVSINPPASDILGFEVHPDHPLRSGEALHAELKGTSGGTAVMFIPGVADNITMAETSPGIYRADFTAPAGEAVQGAAVLARLTVGDRQSEMVQSHNPITIDAVDPKIVGLSPGKDAIVETDSPILYARLHDEGGLGIDVSRVRMFVDGQDVTAGAHATATYVDFEPTTPFEVGQHNVRVRVEDRAGNASSAEWSFTVSPRRRYVHRFDDDVAPGTILSPGNTVGFRLDGTPSGHAVAMIAGVDRDVPLTEVRPGVYEGSFTVMNGQSATEAPVTARFTAPDGVTVEATLPQGLSVAAGPPPAPNITNPADGAQLADNGRIEGTALPNSIVRVKLDYDARLRGGSLPVTGSAGSREVVANGDGHWAVDNLIASQGGFLDSPNTQITVSAVAIDPNGGRSEASTLSLQGGKVYAHRRGQD